MTGGRFDGLRARWVNTAAGNGAGPAQDGREIRAWVVEALKQIPMPDAPVQTPWVVAPSALIAPHLPRPLARIPGRLDRFGAIRLSPHEIGIDTPRAVPWHDVVELRTTPLLDVLTVGTGGSLATLAARLLHTPKIMDGALRAVGEKAAEAVRSLLLIAAAQYAERVATVQIPTAVVHRSGRRGHAVMTSGLFSSAVLALPAVADSVLATAAMHGVPITGARIAPQLDAPPAPGRYRPALGPRAAADPAPIIRHEEGLS